MENKELRLRRTFEDITADIRADWKKVYVGAQPYLEAMRELNDIDDMYGLDTGRDIVAYFLANASTWRGPVARRIKAELNEMLK